LDKTKSVISPTSKFEELIDDIILYIFLFFEEDFKTWGRLSRTNRRMLSVANKHRLVDYEFKVRNDRGDVSTIVHPLYRHQGNLYLTLPKNIYTATPETNISSYIIPIRGGWTPQDKDVITRWFKLRIDPTTLLLHTGDFTFSKSTGYCGHHRDANPDKIPYASAFDCEKDHSLKGRAHVDLRGTPFAVDDTWTHNGWQSNGTWNFSNEDQVVELRGGGFCGWCCPVSAITEHDASIGGWHVQLKVLQHTIEPTTEARIKSIVQVEIQKLLKPILEKLELIQKRIESVEQKSVTKQPRN